MGKVYWVYILASRPRGALYVGITNDVGRRVFQHRTNVGSEHVQRYGIRRLVFAESHASVWAAIAREKQLKKWRREWKIDLIENANPDWVDLYEHMHP